MKQIEISVAKLRILLNDIELISYDIEQLKQSDYEDKNSILLINTQWEELLKQASEKYNSLEKKLEQMRLKQKTIDYIYHELDLIEKQVTESTINTKFPLLVERLEYIEEELTKQFADDQNEQIEELKSKKIKIFDFDNFTFLERLIDVKQRTLTKGQELIELTHSIELFHSSLQNFTEWLTETERYLNNQKAIQRRFGLIQTLLKQIDDHKSFQIQLETYKEHLIDLDKLATHLKFVSPKQDSLYIRNSLIAVQTRWQTILTRTTERTKELQKAFHEAKKVFFFCHFEIDNNILFK
jgi:dystonin